MTPSIWKSIFVFDYLTSTLVLCGYEMNIDYAISSEILTRLDFLKQGMHFAQSHKWVYCNEIEVAKIYTYTQ